MKHPEYDKLIAIAELKQMQRQLGQGEPWYNVNSTIAMNCIASGQGEYIRIAPETATIFVNGVECAKPVYDTGGWELFAVYFRTREQRDQVYDALVGNLTR
jgi:hypothetical protein